MTIQFLKWSFCQPEKQNPKCVWNLKKFPPSWYVVVWDHGSWCDVSLELKEIWTDENPQQLSRPCSAVPQDERNQPAVVCGIWLLTYMWFFLSLQLPCGQESTTYKGTLSYNLIWFFSPVTTHLLKTFLQLPSQLLRLIVTVKENTAVSQIQIHLFPQWLN